MKISVIGCGYLGTVHAACMASLGYEVVGVDIDAARIDVLASGSAPFFEPGLESLLESARDRLSFSTDPSAVAGAAVHFIAVGTPQAADGLAADVTFVDAAVAALVPYLRPGDLVVGKSTVPLGTAERLASVIEQTGARLLWNPEFLREGMAVNDTLHPDRVVYGVRPGDHESPAILDAIYAESFDEGTPRIITDYATAELVKVAANAFLATKISFINAMAEIAEATGANVTTLADALGADERIGRRFLNAGVGFGGGCLPKDIRAFQARATELGLGESLGFLEEVDRVNQRRRDRVIDLLTARFGGDVKGVSIGVLGLAFKPDSDDVRDSPALDIASRLVDLGAIVRATDPAAIVTARARDACIEYRATVDEVAEGAEALVLLTEWPEFRSLDPHEIGDLVAERYVIDGRNCLDPVAWRNAGWEYVGMGRP